MKETDTREILKKVRRIEIATRDLVNSRFAGEYSSVFKGRGIEFSEVREYQPEDDIRMIDWNVTARMGHPYVKKYTEERELVVMFLFDASSSMNFGTGYQTKDEVAAMICALLAFSAIRNNDKVGLVNFTDQVELFVTPRKGRKHVLRLILELLNFKPVHEKTDISKVLEYVNRVVSKHSVLFLISDFMDDGYYKALKVTSQKHDLIAVKINDQRELTIPDVGLVEFEDSETGEQILLDTSASDIRMKFMELNRQREQSVLDMFKSLKVDVIEISIPEQVSSSRNWMNSKIWKSIYSFFEELKSVIFKKEQLKLENRDSINRERELSTDEFYVKPLVKFFQKRTSRERY